MVIKQNVSKVKLDCPYVLILEQSAQPAFQVQEQDSTEGVINDPNKYIFTATIATFIKGKKNNNGREYIKHDYLKHIPYLKEKAQRGILLGELDHPEYFDIKGTKAAIQIIDVWYDEQADDVKIKFKVLDTNYGLEVRKLVDAGVPISVSTRSAGKVDANGVVTLFKIFTVDVVIEPGFTEAVAQRVNESFDFNIAPIYECLEDKKNKSILNKLELVESISDDFTKIYKINESVHTAFFNSNYAEFEIANKINEQNEEMSKVNELEAQVKSLTNMMAKLLENMGQPQAQEEGQEGGQAQVQSQEAQGAQPYGQPVQGVQVQAAQPEIQGGETLGVGAQPSTPISVQPAAQPTNLPPVPSAPVSSGYDMGQIVPQLVGLIQTLTTALQNQESKVQAQDVMLNTIAESFNVENTKILAHFSKLETAFELVNETLNQHALWTGSILEKVNYNTLIAESVGMYQNALATKLNEGLVSTKILENKLNTCDSYVQTVIQNQINETAGVVNQITNMIDEGNMMVGKTSVAGRNVKDLIASLKESNEQIIKESKENGDYLKLANKFPFLQFMSEADKNLYLGESLDVNQKQAIVNALNSYGWTNAKDIHEVMESALASVNTSKEGLGLWLTAAPDEYKDLFENVCNDSEKAMIIRAASIANPNNKAAVNAFWAGLGLEEKIRLSESKKALLESRKNAGHSVEDHQKLVRDQQRRYSDYQFEAYLNKLGAISRR